MLRPDSRFDGTDLSISFLNHVLLLCQRTFKRIEPYRIGIKEFFPTCLLQGRLIEAVLQPIDINIPDTAIA